MRPVAKPSRSVLVGFDDLPDVAHVRIDVVAALLDCSESTVRRRVADGDIPAPRRVGGIPLWAAGTLRRSLLNG